MSTMFIGFTGSREEPPNEQMDTLAVSLAALVKSVPAEELPRTKFEFHHGDCVGRDNAFDSIVGLLLAEGKIRGSIVIHPPLDETLRAYCNRKQDGAVRTVLQAMPFLDRNKRIVECTQCLLACPSGPEALRSGTWSTVRFARKKRDYRILTILPGGQVTAFINGRTKTMLSQGEVI